MVDTPTIGPLIANLAEIMADTIRMPKGERNPQGWSYTSVMDMLDEIRPAMAQRGIVMVPDVETCEWTEGQSARGTATTTCHMTVRWTLYGSDGASISFRTVGEALDTSDKATNKAMTAAQKLAVSKLVMMTTGDAEDIDASHEERVARPEAPRRGPAEDHGVCADHGVPWKRYEKAHEKGVHVWFSHAPLEAGGRWHQREDADEKPTPAPLTPSLAAQAAEIARARTPMPASAVPASNTMAPHGMCPEHKAVLVPIGSTGKIGHWRTVDGKRIACELAPTPGLDQQANDKQANLGWGVVPATAENTREV